MIRKTKQREALKNVIMEAGRPLSTEEIFVLASHLYPKLGRRTVYRNVKEMTEASELVGIDYPGQPMRYELVDEKGSRPHLICRGCNRLYSLPIEEPTVRIPVQEDYIIDGYEVIFFGYCPECRNAGLG